MKKKILSLFALAISIFSLSGCGMAYDMMFTDENTPSPTINVKVTIEPIKKITLPPIVTFNPPSYSSEISITSTPESTNNTVTRTPTPTKSPVVTLKPTVTKSPLVTLKPTSTPLSNEQKLRNEAIKTIPYFEQRYYISKLSGDELESFLAMYKAYMACLDSVTLPKRLSPDKVQNLMFYLNYECPELIQFSSVSYTYYYDSNNLVYKLELPHLCNKATADRYRNLTEKELDRLVAKVRGKSDYEKELFFYEHIIQNNQYVLNNTYSPSPYGVLIEKQGRCEGIARTMKWAMEKCGIQCICIRGIKEGIAFDAHVWNAVNLNGTFYDIDLTMDDCENTDAGYLQQYPLPYGLVNVSKDFIRSEYEIDASNTRFGVPGASNMNKSYRALNNTMVSDRNQAYRLMSAQLSKAYQNKKGSASFQITNPTEYNYFKNHIDDYIMKWLNNNHITTYNYNWYYYSDSTKVVHIDITF